MCILHICSTHETQRQDISEKTVRRNKYKTKIERKRRHHKDLSGNTLNHLLGEWERFIY